MAFAGGQLDTMVSDKGTELISMAILRCCQQNGSNGTTSRRTHSALGNMPPAEFALKSTRERQAA